MHSDSSMYQIRKSFVGWGFASYIPYVAFSGNPDWNDEMTKWRTQRKERNEMTQLFDRPIDHSRQRQRRMPLSRCQAVADTHEITEIKFDLHHKLHNK